MKQSTKKLLETEKYKSKVISGSQMTFADTPVDGIDNSSDLEVGNFLTQEMDSLIKGRAYLLQQ